MEEKIKWLVSVVCGLLATFSQKYGLLIALVLFAMVFDIVTGLLKAKITGTVSSQAGTRGFAKKVALLTCLFFGFYLDYAIPFMVKQGLNFVIPFMMPIGMIFSFYIVLNEGISVLENLDACGVKLPKYVVKMLKTAKDSLEGDDDEDITEE